ncbi:hypothetical protein [Ferrimicrobium acidiphilum]|uniref:hypothetical protein n=1 Tax=Ferrimicrobium acidiphilum TaxID=121039 RepID=UPI0023F15390|nr:hypothetical protein [Ferrimicrobium acidiphilum]
MATINEFLDDRGFIDELIGVIMAMVVAMLLIATIIPIQAAIQDESAVRNAIHLAAQSALPYEFPAESVNAENTSLAVFRARLAGLPEVSCSTPSISLPNRLGGSYTVTSRCDIRVPFIVPFNDVSSFQASISTSLYQGQ